MDRKEDFFSESETHFIFMDEQTQPFLDFEQLPILVTSRRD
jgi:hypothetical protein